MTTSACIVSSRVRWLSHHDDRRHYSRKASVRCGGRALRKEVRGLGGSCDPGDLEVKRGSHVSRGGMEGGR